MIIFLTNRIISIKDGHLITLRTKTLCIASLFYQKGAQKLPSRNTTKNNKWSSRIFSFYLTIFKVFLYLFYVN